MQISIFLKNCQQLLLALKKTLNQLFLLLLTTSSNLIVAVVFEKCFELRLFPSLACGGLATSLNATMSPRMSYQCLWATSGQALENSRHYTGELGDG